MMHDYMKARGLEDRTRITVGNPLPSPIPPSPETPKAILAGLPEVLTAIRGRAIGPAPAADRPGEAGVCSLIPCRTRAGR